MYVCMYVCMHVCMSMHVHVCVHIYVCMCVFVWFVCVWGVVSVSVFVLMFVCARGNRD